MFSQTCAPYAIYFFCCIQYVRADPSATGRVIKKKTIKTPSIKKKNSYTYVIWIKIAVISFQIYHDQTSQLC